MLPYNYFGENSYLRFVPLLTPAVKRDDCSVDQDLLFKRILCVVLAIIVTVVSACVYAATFPVAVYICGISTVPTIFFCDLLRLIDNNLSERGVDLKAVNAFLDVNQAPSISAVDRLRNRSSAARLFIERGGDVNRRDASGRSLLDYLTLLDMECFELFMKNGFNLLSQDRSGRSYFLCIASNRDTKFLRYVLENRLVNIHHVSNEEQVRLWVYLENVEAGQLLRYYGFRVNIEANGSSALLRIVERASGGYAKQSHLPLIDHVRFLLDCGARRITSPNNAAPGYVDVRTVNTLPGLIPILNPPVPQH